MKKVLHQQKLYRLRRVRRFEKRTSARRKRTRITLPERNAVTLHCPEILSITEKHFRSPLLRFIRRVRFHCRTRSSTVTLDCSDVRAINSDAMLLLWAELTRILEKRRPRSIRLTQPHNAKCRQVFTQIGLAKAFNCQETDTSDDDVVHWRAVSGSGVDGEKYAEQLMAPYSEILQERIAQPLWIGVQEAMTNVTHHAYILPREEEERFKAEHQDGWWMFSQEKDEKLTVLICDLGAGIPRTVPITKREVLAPVVRWMRLHKRKDADILSAVLKQTVLRERPGENTETSSRTLRPNRGKGFYNIVKTVRSVDDGKVIIHSNKGLWHSMKPGSQFSKNFKDSIGGTIISWQIPLGESQ